MAQWPFLSQDSVGQFQRYLDQLMDRAENLRPEDQDGQDEAGRRGLCRPRLYASMQSCMQSVEVLELLTAVRYEHD